MFFWYLIIHLGALALSIAALWCANRYHGGGSGNAGMIVLATLFAPFFLLAFLWHFWNAVKYGFQGLDMIDHYFPAADEASKDKMRGALRNFIDRVDGKTK